MPFIRAAKESDFEGISRIQSLPKVVMGTMKIPHFGYTEAQFKSKLADTTYYPFVACVSESNSRVIGFGTLQRSSFPRVSHSGHIFLIVHDEHWRKGIGSLLMESIIELADNWLNLIRLELGVFVDNEPAINLYKKFGFEIEGTKKKMGFRNGKFVDAHMMARVK